MKVIKTTFLYLYMIERFYYTGNYNGFGYINEEGNITDTITN